MEFIQGLSGPKAHACSFCSVPPPPRWPISCLCPHQASCSTSFWKKLIFLRSRDGDASIIGQLIAPRAEGARCHQQEKPARPEHLLCRKPAFNLGFLFSALGACPEQTSNYFTASLKCQQSGGGEAAGTLVSAWCTQNLNPGLLDASTTLQAPSPFGSSHPNAASLFPTSSPSPAFFLPLLPQGWSHH